MELCATRPVQRGVPGDEGKIFKEDVEFSLEMLDDKDRVIQVFSGKGASRHLAFEATFPPGAAYGFMHIEGIYSRSFTPEPERR